MKAFPPIPGQAQLQLVHTHGKLGQHAHVLRFSPFTDQHKAVLEEILQPIAPLS